MPMGAGLFQRRARHCRKFRKMPDDKQTPLMPVLWKSDQMRPAPGVALPAGGVVDDEARIRIAVEEGYHPAAVKAAYDRREPRWSDKVRISICALLAGLLLFFLFPFDRFFKEPPRQLGPLRLGPGAAGPAEIFETHRPAPYDEILRKIDRLYLEKGRLTEAIVAAQEALEDLPDSELQRWAALYYRYWQLLNDAGRFERLSESAGEFLKTSPEDPVAAYFLARGFTAGAERRRSYAPRRAAEVRVEAGTVDEILARSLTALQARIDSGSQRGQNGALADIAAKLELERARLLYLMWKIGGFEEDDHPDVRLRDEALGILDSPALSGKKEALALKYDIYYDILLRWHWFEGSEPIRRKMVPRAGVEAELQELNRLLGGAAGK